MRQVATHLSKMSTESNHQLSPLRKSLFRHSTVTEDSTDGAIVATKTVQIGSTRQPINSNEQPIKSGCYHLSKANYPSQKILPNSSTQQRMSESQTLQSVQANCVNPVELQHVRAQFLARYNEQLTAYEQDLLNRRNSETIRYDQDIPSKETTLQNQACKKASRRRDICDGLPVSSVALLAEKCASGKWKDSSDVLPSEQAALHHRSGPEGENPPKRSERSSDLGSLADDVSENGNFRRLSSSHSVSLTPSRSGERIVELTQSTLPPSACIWQVDRSNMKIPSDIKKKLQNQETITSEYDNFLMRIVKANPQFPFTTDLDILERAIEASVCKLRSQPSSECDEEYDLQISDESVPSFGSNRHLSNKPVTNGINDGEVRSDEIDGKRHHTGSSLSGATAKRTPYHHQRMANGYPSARPSAGRGRDAGAAARSTALCQPVVNDRANPSYSTRSNGVYDRGMGSEAVDRGAAAAARALSHQPVANGHVIHSHRDCSHDNGYLHEASSHDEELMHMHMHLERAIFCKNRSCNKDFSCCQGKRQLLELQNLFQTDKLKDGQIILEYLWHHSRTCYEVECAVPFCDTFRKGPHPSFKEYFAAMTSCSMNRQLQMALVHTMKNQVHRGNFLHLSPSDPVNHDLWQTACILEGQFLGEFGDFNILRGRISFCDHSDLNVVIKKAVSYKDATKVYFQIGQKPSPYIVQNYWCSEISDNMLFVCSEYYPDLFSLRQICFHRPTSDLYLMLLLQVVLAAQYLHTLKPEIVYLNWKCSNVLWDGRSMNIKLCNFSKAIQLKRGGLVTCPSSVIKSFDPCFTAPEVLCGKPVSFYSDIWGIGCLFYELLTKSPPYPEHSHKPPATIREKVTGDHTNIEHTYPRNSTHAEILCHCWEKIPSDRWTTAGLRDRLQGLLPKGSEVER